MAEEGLSVLGWRECRSTTALGAAARRPMPHFRQLFLAGAAGEIGLELERRAFCVRKRIEHEAGRLLPVAVAPHDRLQGHAHRAASSSGSSRT